MVILTNISPSIVTLRYQFVVTDNLNRPDVSVVSLNGLPPGSAVTNTISLPPGGSTSIPLSYVFVLNDALRIYTIELWAEVNGGGKLWFLDGIPLGNAVLPPEVPLSIVSRDGQLIVIWNVSNATLEEADSVTSSWRDVAGPPCGGYYIPPDPTTNAAKFFRLRYPGP